MGATIKEVAKEAGVSIATVSHVINGTRYVSPELIKKVENAMHETGYTEKYRKKKEEWKTGTKTVVAVVVPEAGGTLYIRLVRDISESLLKKGYLTAVYYSNYDTELEKTSFASVRGQEYSGDYFDSVYCGQEKLRKGFGKRNSACFFGEKGRRRR